MVNDWRQEKDLLKQEKIPKRPWGALPSTTENNPKEWVNVISLRVEKEYHGDVSCTPKEKSKEEETKRKEATPSDLTSKEKEATPSGLENKKEEAKAKPVTPPLLATNPIPA
nr:uncharacterized protein LOC104108284 [Ipomoea batatas]